jgi:hypothetical protein
LCGVRHGVIFCALFSRDTTGKLPMATTIQVWRSFSCNNSSSYRLVARFDDRARADEVQKELTSFFAEHAKEMDRLTEEGDFPEGPCDLDKALAEKYSFEWTEPLMWGDDMQEGDEPSVTAHDGVVIVWHTYCGGFADGIPNYLTKRGGKVEGEDTKRPPVSVLFEVPAESEKARALVDEFKKAFDDRKSEDGDQVEDFKPPWSSHEGWGPASYFFDGTTMGFFVPFDPTSLDDLKKWLSDGEIKNPTIRLCEYNDRIKFTAIANAKCTACGTGLQYLDPTKHAIAAAQLACKKCGGMFDFKPIEEAAVAAEEAKKAAKKK